MKRILQTLLLAAMFVATQSAWSIVRDRHDWLPQVESPYPMDAEASFNLPALGTYADRHEGDKQNQQGDPFPANMAGIVIGD
ncbi:MAG TPA: hypothetical protein VGP15_13175 [Burkholderiales bacterium]|nr:hypothetical protein [Burkholderiales bacterium]